MIEAYIQNIIKEINNRTMADEYIIQEAKRTILEHFGNSTYIGKHIIEHLDRVIQNKKHNISLSKEQIENTVAFLSNIYDECRHTLHTPIKYMIDNRLYTFNGFIGNIDERQIYGAISIIEAVIQAHYLSNLVKKDSVNNLQQKKDLDREKIDKAKKILMAYIDDIEIKHCINSIHIHKNPVSEKIIQRSLFYRLTVILGKTFNLNKKEKEAAANYILNHCFNQVKDMSIGKNTHTFNYKGYHLTYYKSK